MKYDPQKSIWFNDDIQYLFNQEIIEYDLKDAGFSLIKQFHILSNDEINRLSKLPKGFERHKEIGLMQRNNKELSKKLSDKFSEIRKIFIYSNNITDDNIISVKKDAFFIIGNIDKTKFGELEFRKKNIYNNYIRFPNIQNLEIYHSEGNMDIKGMSDISINKHRLYMLDFLNNIIHGIENNSPRIKRYMINFISEYKLGNLEEAYYLEFNNKSKDINPVFNLQNIIIPLIQIIMKEVS